VVEQTAIDITAKGKKKGKKRKEKLRSCKSVFFFSMLTLMLRSRTNSNSLDSGPKVDSTRLARVHAISISKIRPMLNSTVITAFESERSVQLNIVGLSVLRIVASIGEAHVLSLEGSDSVVAAEDPLLHVVAVVFTGSGIALRQTDSAAGFLVFACGETVLGGDAVVSEVSGDGAEGGSRTEGENTVGVGDGSLFLTVVSLNHGLTTEAILFGHGVFLFDLLVLLFEGVKNVLLGFVMLLLGVEIRSLGGLPLESSLLVLFVSFLVPLGDFTLRFDVVGISSAGKMTEYFGVILLQAVELELRFNILDIVGDFSGLENFRKMLGKISAGFIQDIQEVVEAGSEGITGSQVVIRNV